MTIFHKIVNKEIPAYVIAEDDNHLAILDIFPAESSPGQTLILPKHPQPSKFSEIDPDVLESTMRFAQKVAKHLEEKLENVLRVAVVIEGLQIDYLHIKLYPIYNGIHMDINKVKEADKAYLERLTEQLRM